MPRNDKYGYRGMPVEGLRPANFLLRSQTKCEMPLLETKRAVL
jgi:hypothetical protein